MVCKACRTKMFGYLYDTFLPLRKLIIFSMSKISKQVQKCPYCGKKVEYKMYESVNSTLNPEFKDKLMTGELFDVKCECCNKVFRVFYNLLYHDMKKNLMILFAPTDYEDSKKQMNELLDKFPGTRRTLYRITDDFRKFIEKIHIFDDDLNDVAIELSKVIIRGDKESNIPDNSSLHYMKIVETEKSGKVLVFIIVPEEGENTCCLLPFDAYLQYNESVKDDAYFKTTYYAENIDEEWILERVSKGKSTT